MLASDNDLQQLPGALAPRQGFRASGHEHLDPAAQAPQMSVSSKPQSPLA
jgi:hypothetical protein